MIVAALARLLWTVRRKDYSFSNKSFSSSVRWWYIENCGNLFYIVNVTTKVKVCDGEMLKYCLIFVSYQPQKVTQMTLSAADISDWQFEAHDLLWCTQWELYCDFLMSKWQLIMITFVDHVCKTALMNSLSHLSCSRKERVLMSLISLHLIIIRKMLVEWMMPST